MHIILKRPLMSSIKVLLFLGPLICVWVIEYIVMYNWNKEMSTDNGNIKILSPAKINLFLYVTGKRPDGYHKLFTLLCQINLYDDITLDFKVKETSVSCSHPDIPNDESNLAHKSATLFYEASKIKGNVGITIDKKIPAGAGLGGGSSNAATVLKAMNDYYNSPLSTDELMSIGLSIGTDVPFFIFGNNAVATGIGEKLRNYQLSIQYYIVLIYPEIIVSTANVYKNLNFGLTKCEKKIKDYPFEGIRFIVEEHLHNDLESVTISMNPEIGMVKKLLIDHGAAGALMSGSGSSVFGIFYDKDIARQAYDSLVNYDGIRVFLVQTIT